jgi:HAD superfamily hydrolase (TIGR01549 family)
VPRTTTGGRVTAITFDFWNTLYSADAGTMDTARPKRLETLRELLAACSVHPSADELQQAYRSGFDAYMEAWMSGAHFGAREQVLCILARFGLDPAAVDRDLISRAVREIEDASLLAPLQLLPGARETIPALAAAGYRLGVISDTSLTPGRVLRQFLDKDDLLAIFEALTFSDETGYTKPDRRMFESTLATLGAQPTQAAHVGDTPRTDIAGAQAMGMVAIRCAGEVDHQEPPEADFVIKDHREIQPILDQLSRLDAS